MSSFRFCETCLLHIKLFVVNKSWAIKHRRTVERFLWDLAGGPDRDVVHNVILFGLHLWHLLPRVDTFSAFSGAVLVSGRTMLAPADPILTRTGWQTAVTTGLVSPSSSSSSCWYGASHTETTSSKPSAPVSSAPVSLTCDIELSTQSYKLYNFVLISGPSWVCASSSEYTTHTSWERVPQRRNTTVWVVDICFT